MAARAVLIEAGIVGCGVAEHLTRMGWRDVLVVDGGPFFRTVYPQVALTSPCSVHGFKFASVVGEILARFSPTMWRCPAVLPYSTCTALLASPEDLFAEQCKPKSGAHHDIQTP